MCMTRKQATIAATLIGPLCIPRTTSTCCYYYWLAARGLDHLTRWCADVANVRQPGGGDEYAYKHPPKDGCMHTVTHGHTTIWVPVFPPHRTPSIGLIDFTTQPPFVCVRRTDTSHTASSHSTPCHPLHSASHPRATRDNTFISGMSLMCPVLLLLLCCREERCRGFC